MFLLYAPLFVTLLVVGMIWRRRYARRQKQAAVRQLLAWAAQTPALDPVLQQWAQRLTATEAEVLLDLLAGYCDSLNWDLRWLFTSQIDKAPVLKAAVEESVSAYTRAILISLQLEEDVRAYYVYQAFEAKPYSRKQRPIVQQLYAKIKSTDQNAALLPSPNRLFGRFFRRTVTRKEQVTAIQRAFARDPAYAMAALKEVLALEPMVSTPPMNQTLSPLTTMPAHITV